MCDVLLQQPQETSTLSLKTQCHFQLLCEGASSLVAPVLLAPPSPPIMHSTHMPLHSLPHAMHSLGVHFHFPWVLDLEFLESRGQG